MADDSDGDAYDDIDMDETGKPIIATGNKRPPIPLPKGSSEFNDNEFVGD